MLSEELYSRASLRVQNISIRIPIVVQYINLSGFNKHETTPTLHKMKGISPTQGYTFRLKIISPRTPLTKKKKIMFSLFYVFKRGDEEVCCGGGGAELI